MLHDLSDKAIRRIASLPANLAYQWSRLPGLTAPAEQPQFGLPGSAPFITLERKNEAAVVLGLERDGVFVTDLESLGLAEDSETGIMKSCGELGRRLADRAAAASGARPAMIQTGPEDLLRHPAIYRWGLNAALLRIAHAYLRRPVGYDGPLMFHTPADGREVATRKWHLDREDWRMIKVGLYLNDVGEADGPFQILKKRQHPSGSVRYAPLDMAGLGRKLGTPATEKDIVTCTGKAGTLVFADTAQFYHRGKPATNRDRSAIFFSYFARPPRHPFFCGRSRLSRAQIARLIEGLHPFQQASAAWRDSLPWPARMIPSSRI